MSQNAEIRFSDSTASVWLDAVRAGAAILVLLEHWRNLFFVDYSEVQGSHLLISVPYALTGVGHSAVILFFLLSGYFIGGSVLQAERRLRWSWSDYLLKRVVRLWIVLLPSLLLCAIWDHTGLALHRAPLLYGGVLHPSFIPKVAERLGFETFLGNAFFLQVVKVPTFGSDGALWSLAYEFWYYILFPLGFFALRPGRGTRTRLLCGVLFAATAWIVRGEILLYFGIWLAGVALQLIPKSKWRKEPGVAWISVGCAVFLYLFLVISKMHGLSMHESDVLIAILSWLLIAVILRWSSQSADRSQWTHIRRTWARFSYSLYTLHTPILVFLTSLILGDRRWQPTPIHLFLAALCLAVTLVYSYAIATATEFHTDAVRGWLETRLKLRTMAR